MKQNNVKSIPRLLKKNISKKTSRNFRPYFITLLLFLFQLKTKPKQYGHSTLDGETRCQKIFITCYLFLKVRVHERKILLINLISLHKLKNLITIDCENFYLKNFTTA